MDKLFFVCARHSWERALVVCCSTVGSMPAVMDPIRDGLGDRLAGVFDETTPEKCPGTAVGGLKRAPATAPARSSSSASTPPRW
ncbi:MAG: hypothetical protein RI568_08055, partial [Natronomonas sp.]|nr:hypothetical protein [Natronomonas sp.]